ncbi:MAG TPA: cache domain-containing protein [Victivallales bacterium]|nr:cache domain-containing protein [Victivallales bacterium]HPO91410.1 cache domain-containing protein [Victivallales bacterium]HRR06830.1 cache domain-containing protein [Victivallales bacterium]HRR29184.1 cache domain-containing protein [Victivallales bacterium]HRU01127.1 cache domain-containing protein [Victivallales bacterium]
MPKYREKIYYIFNNKVFLISIFIILLVGSIVTSLLSYFSSRNTIRKEISENELPLTSDNVYSEIQRDLIRPVFISSQMACDTFLRDWILNGEKDSKQMARYLKTIKEKFNTFSSFLVSERTFNYYYSGGILKKVSEIEYRDIWYFRVRKMKEDYEINIDPDMANRDTMTIFVNYKIYGYNGEYLGVTGVGLTIDAVTSLIEKYQKKYNRRIYFTDMKGNIKLCGAAFPKNIKNILSFEHGEELLHSFKKNENKSLMFSKGQKTIHFNTRFIPEFKWYLIVEQEEEHVIKKIFNAFLLNLFICSIISTIVMILCFITFKIYKKEIELLRGIIPICCICKKIRDDKGYWNQVEDYISQHSNALFTHGICPECMEKHYPQFNSKEQSKIKE